MMNLEIDLREVSREDAGRIYHEGRRRGEEVLLCCGSNLSSLHFLDWIILLTIFHFFHIYYICPMSSNILCFL